MQTQLLQNLPSSNKKQAWKEEFIQQEGSLG